MTILMKALWNPFFRILGFWLLFVATVYGASMLWADWLDFKKIEEVFSDVEKQTGAGDFSQAIASASSQEFVRSIALLIVASGAGLLLSFFVMHALYVRIALYSVRKLLVRRKDAIAFAADYETRILPVMMRHPLIGTAWKEFDETLLKGRVADGGPIQNTVRPQSFINFGLAREKLPGLKIIGSISGYFVGIGLLLTFIGIVLALHEAAQSVENQSVDAMQTAMKRLLSVASFKFSTSIAGLFTSIVFALGSRSIVIWIEGAFSHLCDSVEHRLIYTAPQSITAEMHEVAKEQRDQLKEINSDRYFTKLAETVAPLFDAAMSRAMAPVATNIASAVDQLKSTSQSGLSDMTREFAAALHNNAGIEMKGLQDSLREIQVALSETQSGLRGGGEDFSRRLSEAAENLNRLVGEAGARLEGSAESSRAGLAEVVAAFKQTMDTANARVEAELGSAASGASSKVEEAMGRVLERLENQVGSLMRGLGDLQSGAADGVLQTQSKLRETQDAIVASMSDASAKAAEAVKTTLVDTLSRVATEIDRFQAAIARGEAALSHQASAIGDATGKTRNVADAFAETAQRITQAATPLLQSAERMAQATNELSSSVASAVGSLQSSNSTSSDLAQALREHIERLGTLWQGYRNQFDKVDQDLARAIAALSDATVAQSDRLAKFATDTDVKLGSAVSRLGSVVGEIRETTGDFSDSVEKLSEKLRSLAAG